jgi:hypothetical protein
MFTRITNLDGILRTPTCCECEQEISPNVDSQLVAHIPILRIRIHTGGPIRATDSRCTLVIPPTPRREGIYKQRQFTPAVISMAYRSNFRNRDSDRH